ncbi:MAG: DapH/DapD/GlmU-related protein [Chthoniobacterales bacterium]
MFEMIRADLNRKRNAYGVRPEDKTFFRHWITPLLEFGTFAVIDYRFGRWVYSVKIPVIRQILIALYLILDVFCAAMTGIKIHPESEIGPGLVVHTFSCIHVLVKRMGHSCTINQGVSLANVRGSGRPTIGDNCYFGAGCKVMGGITIGSNVVVAANSVVISDVPDACTVMGVPARIISREVSSPYLKAPVAPVMTPATTAT